jgi:CMP-N-acetylneuraminic acid synthetase
LENNYGVVALLPMKANSVRVKSKNFRYFAGKPLYRWILDTLLEIDQIDAIVINTDARELLSESGLNHGDAEGRIIIRDRRPEICGDMVSMNKVLADDIENVSAKVYLMTHTTNPLLGPATIVSALQEYRKNQSSNEADCLFTVNKTQTRFYRKDVSPVNHDPSELLRTQDLEPWFEENSNLYIFDKDSFSRTGARIGERPLMFETPPLESVDIDTPEQWVLAEALALYLRMQEEA